MGLEKAWYNSSAWLILLRPLELLFRWLAKRRREKYQQGVKPSWTAPVPVIIVGNISVGGTGKSPLVIWLINWLRAQGLKPGVISRGYRAKPPVYPYFVTAGSSAFESGDEPLMIVRRTAVPLVIDPDRVAAAKLLLEQTDCNVIISDDGLQHYALNRAIEIAVLDGKRGFGNGRCLPEGPLREPVSRLDEVDLVVVNGASENSFLSQPIKAKCSTMTVAATQLCALNRSRVLPLNQWQAERQVHAVAGIGNPQRFYTTLQNAGFHPLVHSYPDHHHFTDQDLQFDDGRAIIMTEKDAVKCDHMDLNNAWFLQVEAQLDEDFELRLKDKLSQHFNRHS
ncbi:MAG: tetraacyldisaccharide 4'-kinase [Amphritea sp.]